MCPRRIKLGSPILQPPKNLILRVTNAQLALAFQAMQEHLTPHVLAATNDGWSEPAPKVLLENESAESMIQWPNRCGAMEVAFVSPHKLSLMSRQSGLAISQDQIPLRGYE